MRVSERVGVDSHSFEVIVEHLQPPRVVLVGNLGGPTTAGHVSRKGGGKGNSVRNSVIGQGGRTVFVC